MNTDPSALGLPVPVPGHPHFYVYEVSGGEDVAVVWRIGRSAAMVIARVPCDWAMEEKMPRIVNLVEEWDNGRMSPEKQATHYYNAAGEIVRGAEDFEDA